MKKILAVTLAMLMLVSLFAGCKKDTGAPSSPAPGGTSSSAPPSNTQDSGSGSGGAPSAGGAQGFYTDDADWFGRDPYKFAYVSYGWTFLNELLSASIIGWSERINFEYTVYDAGQDMNAFFAACESFASMGYDGVFIDPDPSVAKRVIEVCDELELKYMPVLNPLVDNDSRRYLAPAVNLDSYTMGEIQAQWFIDNYKSYWPNVEPSEVGFLFLYFSSNENFIVNMEGSHDTYAKAFPDLVDKNFIYGDMLGFDLNAQGGLEYSSTVITSRTEFKYWYVTSCLEDIGQGAARAAEDLNIEPNVLVFTNGVNWLIQDWDNGYEGCWVGGIHFGTDMWAEPLACGLVALCDGRATYANIWGTEHIPAGQPYPVYPIETRAVTRDTYKDYLKYLEDYLK